jgi:hypothetical protein
MNINDIDDVFKENIEGNIEEFLLSFPYRVHVTKGKDNKRTSLQIEVEAWAYSCGLEDKAHAKIARLDNEGIWKEVIERQNKALSLVNE